MKLLHLPGRFRCWLEPHFGRRRGRQRRNIDNVSYLECTGLSNGNDAGPLASVLFAAYSLSVTPSGPFDMIHWQPIRLASSISSPAPTGISV